MLPSTPTQAAAPQPPEIIHSESASTASLIDVDAPSVRTVPSDFLEQDVQTDTQAARIEREEEAEDAEREARKKAVGRGGGGSSGSGGGGGGGSARAKGQQLHEWLTARFEGLSEGAASALVFGNLVGVVGLSALISYRAWGLYESGRLGWKSLGLGAGVVAVVGAVEVVLGSYLYKTNWKKHE